MNSMTIHQLAEKFAPTESLSKLFALCLGALYLVGFLVVAVHLSNYGISSFSMLQLQYLAGGVWVLGPPVAHAAIVHTARRFDERVAPEVVGRFNWQRFAISTTLTGITPLLFVGLLRLIPNVWEEMSLQTGIKLVLFYLTGWIVAQMCLSSLQVAAGKETPWRNRSQAAPFYATSLVLLVIAYGLWFAVHIYPTIPFSLGGGKPLTVAFFEGEKRMPDEIKRADEFPKRSVPYKLLMATDKCYIVVSLSPNEQSIEINRDSVAGMVVLNEEIR